MRRTLATVAVSGAVLITTALPVLAADETDAGTRGSATGAIVALVLGVIFAAWIVAWSNRVVEFGDEPAHAEDAHDVRDGFAEHDVAMKESPTAAEREGIHS